MNTEVISYGLININVDYAIGLISDLLVDVLDYAARHRLSTDNVKIYMSPLLVDVLQLGDSFCVGEHRFPIERDDELERQSEDTRYTSGVYIANPDW